MNGLPANPTPKLLNVESNDGQFKRILPIRLNYVLYRISQDYPDICTIKNNF